jgi:putative phosphoesterase
VANSRGFAESERFPDNCYDFNATGSRGISVRIAIVSDIHGNGTAFDAVLRDLRNASPDLILHGGDLADGGSSPAAIVDKIRELGWPGVIGNTDEMLAMPETLAEFAKQSPKLKPMFDAIEEMAAASRAKLGEERLAWLRALPRVQLHGDLGLVHASPESRWKSPGADASDEELERVYRPLAKSLCVYGHIHRPFIRRVSDLSIVNSGSVGLPHDDDRRAAYVLIENGHPAIRRVEYDVEREIQALRKSGLPHAEWIVKILATASPQMP